MKSTTLATRVWTAIGSGLAWIGLFASILSAISALVRIFEVGLSGLFADIVLTYRQFMDPLYRFSRYLFPDVSLLQVDIFVVYLTLFSMCARATISPLFDEEYFDNERSYISRKETVLLDEPPESETSLPEHAQMGRQTEQGYEMLIEHHRPKALVWIKWAMLSLVLWPVISFLPARRIRFPSVLFVTPTPDAWGTDVILNSQKVIFANWFIRMQKLQFHKLIEMVLLPVSILIFFLLATYNPLP